MLMQLLLMCLTLKMEWFEKSICRNSGMLAIENSGPYATDIVVTLPEGNMENTASITTIDDIIVRKIENMRNKKFSTPKIIP